MAHYSARQVARFAAVACASAILLPTGVMAAVNVQITDLSPASPVVLSSRASLYARVVYDSDRPLKLQAQGWLGGREVKAAMYNASQTYPAGHGEGMVWLAYNAGGRIDQIRAVAYDNRWHPITRATAGVQAEWSAQAPPATEAPWVRALDAAQQRVITQEAHNYMNGPLGWVAGALALAMFLTVPGYLILQTIALRWLRGRGRWIAAAPLIVMLPTYAFCLYAFSRESNLWPISAIFLSPPAFLYVLVILLVFHRERNQPPAPNET